MLFAITASKRSMLTVFLAYLLLQYTVEDENEHALQRVKDGEQVRHDDCALVDVHQSKSPGEAQ